MTKEKFTIDNAFIKNISWPSIFQITQTYSSLPPRPDILKTTTIIFNLLTSVLEDDDIPDHIKETHWKIIMLLPGWLWHTPSTRTLETASMKEKAVASRILLFLQAKYKELHISLTESQKAHENNKIHRDEPQMDHTTSYNATLTATKFATLGEFRKAMQSLDNTNKIADCDSFKIQQQLNEAAPHGQLPEKLTFNTPYIKIQLEDIKQTIKLLPRGSAPGISGLRNDHLRQLLDYEIGPAITTIINLMLQEKIPTQLLENITDTAATLFTKSETAIRPILILETYIRIASRVAAHKATKIIKPILKNQFGIQIKDAMIDIITGIRIHQAVRPKSVTIKLDISSAFNNVSRNAIFQKVQDLLTSHPEIEHLARYVNLVYTTPIHAKTRGKACTTFTSGVVQGDPSSSLLFCLAINDAIKSAANIVQPHGSIFAYIDDITIIAPQEIAALAIDSIKSQLHLVGLNINLNKSALFLNSPQANHEILIPQYFSTPSETIEKFLGTKICSEIEFGAPGAQNVERIFVPATREHIFRTEICVHFG